MKIVGFRNQSEMHEMSVFVFVFHIICVLLVIFMYILSTQICGERIDNLVRNLHKTFVAFRCKSIFVSHFHLIYRVILVAQCVCVFLFKISFCSCVLFFPSFHLIKFMYFNKIHWIQYTNTPTNTNIKFLFVVKTRNWEIEKEKERQENKCRFINVVALRVQFSISIQRFSIFVRKFKLSPLGQLFHTMYMCDTAFQLNAAHTRDYNLLT